MALNVSLCNHWQPQTLALCHSALAQEGGTTDNIVLFDRRDYITIEGFVNRVGQIYLVQVLRNGLVAGAASGVIEAGGLNEINHPGGALINSLHVLVAPQYRIRDT
eukprot:17605-Heterococcus_DN1.PRE.2